MQPMNMVDSPTKNVLDQFIRNEQKEVLWIRTPFVIAEEGNPNWRGRLITIYLLIKIACFVKKVNNIFSIKSSWYKLVSARRSAAPILPLQLVFPGCSFKRIGINWITLIHAGVLRSGALTVAATAIEGATLNIAWEGWSPTWWWCGGSWTQC